MLVNNLSVFFPAFNEEKNIRTTVEKAVKVLKSLNLKWEILIINDGSKDQTGDIAENLSSKYKDVYFHNQQNGGYGEALKSGFKYTKYDWIAYTDSDGQFDFEEIKKFLENASEYDLLLGYRIRRMDSLIRFLIAKGWALCIFIFFGEWFKDVDCGFKMVKREVINKIQPLKSSRGGMINAELAIKTKNAGFKITQIGVNHYPRLYGKPTGASLKVIVNSFLDLLKLRLNLK